MIQYDFFEAFDPNKERDAKIEDMNERLKRTQRRFFAENKELVKLIVQQQKQIDELNNRISRLMK